MKQATTENGNEIRYQHPATGESWTKEQYLEYVKVMDKLYEVACGDECYGCSKCEA